MADYMFFLHKKIMSRTSRISGTLIVVICPTGQVVYYILLYHRTNILCITVPRGKYITYYCTSVQVYYGTYYCTSGQVYCVLLYLRASIIRITVPQGKYDMYYCT